MLYLYRIALIFVFAACSSVAEKPRWIHAPKDQCPPGTYCAVGMGGSLSEANASARAEVAKFFSTHISSEFSSTLTSDQQQTIQIDSETIREDVDSIINAVEILQSYNHDSMFYSFAALKKRRVINLYKEKIAKIDSALKQSYESNSLPGLLQALKDLPDRDEHNSILIILDTPAVSQPISNKEIKEKIASITDDINIALIKGPNKAIDKKIAESINAIGIKLTPKNYTHKIEYSYDYDEAHLNVKGFKKYNFKFSLTLRNQKGSELSTINKALEESGRSFSQAENNAISKILDFIENEIATLSF